MRTYTGSVAASISLLGGPLKRRFDLDNVFSYANAMHDTILPPFNLNCSSSLTTYYLSCMQSMRRSIY